MGALISMGEDGARERIRSVETPVQQFFLTKTKRELFERALKDDILLMPCYTAQDILSDDQLQGREFWWKTEVPDRSGPSVMLPGPFARMSGTPVRFQRGAPSIGEHNEEIYGRTIGLTKNQLNKLKEKGVI
jgi:crotonobetainyl-CoA:carnitine CoA-transferase CaiB-like acyl-CoA transferase